MATSYPRETFPYAIPERYQCEHLLGYGGSGLVYRAYDQRLQRTVAIKFSRSPSLISRNRLVSEARLLSKVSTPSLCRVYDIGEPEEASSSLFMVMEYIDGTSLSDLRKSISLNEVLDIICKLAKTLALLHQAGYAHNDIKTQNIILSEHSGIKTPVLVDLSIAETLSPETQQKDINQLVELLLLILIGITSDVFLMQPAEHSRRLPHDIASILKRSLDTNASKPIRAMSDFHRELTVGKNKLLRRRRQIGWAATIVVSTIILASAALNETKTGGGLHNAVAGEQSKSKAFTHYAKHLIEEGDITHARSAINLALQHFENSTSNERDENLAHHQEYIEFLLALDSVFSNTEFTAKLLNAINKMGQPTTYSKPKEAYLTLAKAYLGLAKVNKEQKHLRERWVHEAQKALTAARGYTSTEQYRVTLEAIESFQSKAGTDCSRC